jgi:hypothetical protein
MSTFDYGIEIQDSSSANGYTLQITGSTLISGSISLSGSINVTGSLSINNTNLISSLPTSFNYSFGSNPLNTIFLQIPATDTSANAPVHYQLSWTATSGSTFNSSIVGGSSYFIGTYNGGGNEFIADIYQKRFGLAPGVTMSVSLGGAYYNIAASFTGSSYRISGSYMRIPS